MSADRCPLCGYPLDAIGGYPCSPTAAPFNLDALPADVRFIEVTITTSAPGIYSSDDAKPARKPG